MEASRPNDEDNDDDDDYHDISLICESDVDPIVANSTGIPTSTSTSTSTTTSSTKAHKRKASNKKVEKKPKIPKNENSLGDED